MKIVVFGLGSIGKRHVCLLKELGEFDIYAFRSGRGNTASIEGVTNIDRWTDVESIKPDFAIIANPTHLHFETCLRCAERKIHIFCEKPLGVSADYGLDHLLGVIATNKLTSYVAYPLRFHPYVKSAKSLLEHLDGTWNIRAVCRTHLADWRDYKTYSAHKSQGGGAVLELSHEIDYCEYLMGKVTAMSGYTKYNKTKMTDAETSARIRCFHEGGGESTIELDIMSLNPERRFVLSNGERTIDFWLEANDDIYREQLTYFIDNLGRTDLMNNLPEAVGLFRRFVKIREG